MKPAAYRGGGHLNLVIIPNSLLINFITHNLLYFHMFVNSSEVIEDSEISTNQ